MKMNPGQAKVLVIGNDDRLAYLLKRYTDQSECALMMHAAIPTREEIHQIQPVVVIFPSMEVFQAAQALVELLLAQEIFVMACVAAADEALAREIGADACLLHPFTYQEFWAAISTACPTEA